MVSKKKLGVVGLALLAALAVGRSGPSKKPVVEAPRKAVVAQVEKKPQREATETSVSSGTGLYFGRGRLALNEKDWTEHSGLANLHFLKIQNGKACFGYSLVDEYGNETLGEFHWKPSETVEFKTNYATLAVKLLKFSKKGAVFAHQRTQKFFDLVGKETVEKKTGQLLVPIGQKVNVAKAACANGTCSEAEIQQHLAESKISLPPSWTESGKMLEESHRQWAKGTRRTYAF